MTEEEFRAKLTPEGLEAYLELPEDRESETNPYRLHQEFRFDPAYQEMQKHRRDRRIVKAKTLFELEQERKERRMTLSWKTYRFQDWRGETIVFLIIAIMIGSAFFNKIY